MPASAVTDYHERIRDAVKDALAAAVPGLAWHAVDDLDAGLEKTAPCGIVCAVGPEGERPEMSTNASDGIGYPVAVLFLGVGTARGEKRTGPNSLTEYRRVTRTTFNNKRLSGVSQVGWCEVSDSGPLIDEKHPKFQKVSTAMVVMAVGRFPRS